MKTIIPAQNEANVIGVCIDRMFGPHYLREQFFVVMVDKNDPDGTAQIDYAAADVVLLFSIILPAALPHDTIGDSCLRSVARVAFPTTSVFRSPLPMLAPNLGLSVQLSSRYVDVVPVFFRLDRFSDHSALSSSLLRRVV